MYTIPPPAPIAPACPICGRPAASTVVRTEHGVTTAHHLDDAEHGWLVRWSEGAA